MTLLEEAEGNLTVATLMALRQCAGNTIHPMGRLAEFAAVEPACALRLLPEIKNIEVLEDQLDELELLGAYHRTALNSGLVLIQ